MKRFIVLVLSLAMVLTFFIQPTNAFEEGIMDEKAPVYLKRADFNGDGSINIEDSIYLTKNLFSPESYPIIENPNKAFQSITFNSEGELIWQKPDGETINLGTVKNSDSTSQKTISKIYYDENDKLMVELNDGESVDAINIGDVVFPIEEDDEPTENLPSIIVSNTSANAGATKVTVVVSMENNPGFLTMALKIAFDNDILTLTKVSTGIDFIDYNFTAPRNKISGCTAAWFASDLPEEIIDGDIMTLQFTIAANAPKGQYPITISCPDDGSTVDGNKQAFTMSSASGYIMVN